jgi:AbiTii
VTVPLILQIQQAALDSNASVTDALRRAKLACAKLGLAEFGDWVDRDLNGYMDIPVKQLPAYRKLHGKPEFYNPFHGWQPIIFNTTKAAEIGSFAPIGMSISAIEESLRDAKADGSFEFPYSPELAKPKSWEDVRKIFTYGYPFRRWQIYCIKYELFCWSGHLKWKNRVFWGMA